MLYTAKCFWPGVTEGDLRVAAARAGNPYRQQARFRGALYLPGDELVLCLFDSASPASVKRVSERAGMPCERVIESVWVAPRDAPRLWDESGTRLGRRYRRLARNLYRRRARPC
jgi:Protein of unknown function (DUF4242)